MTWSTLFLWGLSPPSSLFSMKLSSWTTWLAPNTALKFDIVKSKRCISPSPRIKKQQVSCQSYRGPTPFYFGTRQTRTTDEFKREGLNCNSILIKFSTMIDWNSCRKSNNCCWELSWKRGNRAKQKYRISLEPTHD